MSSRAFERVTAHPLCWPTGWKRESGVERARFGDCSVARTARQVLLELERMGVGDWNVVISSNVALRLDGLPRANQRVPEDPGVAVYFKLKGEPHVLACDRWDRPEHNLRAIAKHIAALRGQERWGVGSLAQAFTGYKALPEQASAPPWWRTLGLDREPESLEDARTAYRSRSKSLHPDQGGDERSFRLLLEAYNAAREHFGAGVQV